MPERKARPLVSEGWRGSAMGPLLGSAGRYSLGHSAKKPEWVCTSELFVLYKSAEQDASFRRYVRCRKCDGCRSYKRAMWCARAIHESVSAASQGRRTWVLTATHRIRPDEGGDDIFAREITLALKRLRELAAFRYMVVFERHKPRTGAGETVGYPHCHGLVHEVDRILYSDFRAVFSRIGFFEATLLKGDPAKAAGYVGKYITKTENPKRIRASQAYGGQGPAQPRRLPSLSILEEMQAHAGSSRPHTTAGEAPSEGVALAEAPSSGGEGGRSPPKCALNAQRVINGN